MKKIGFFTKLAFAFLVMCCGLMLFYVGTVGIDILFANVDGTLKGAILMAIIFPAIIFWIWCILKGMNRLCFK